MKKLVLLFSLLLFSFFDCIAQTDDAISGAIKADSVQVSRSGKRKERRDAAIRKKSRMLVRDLIEHSRIQFEPEVGFYHGNQVNMNVGHYTKTGVSSVNEMGAVSGWHEDKSGGKYSGKPMLQIFNGWLYCNLEPILTSSRPEIIGKSARESALAMYSKIGEIDTESSEEVLSNWHAFYTEYYKIENIREVGDYHLRFDVVINQFNIINNTSYDKFVFECIINVLDARMSMRIVAGNNRACASYFGYMNIIRGNSF